MIPTKEEAKLILKKYLEKRPNIEHCLLVGGGMRGIAEYLAKPKEEVDRWYVIGVLHDIDVERYNGDIREHCIVGERILLDEGVDKEIIHSIKTHNQHLGLERTRDEENALYSCDGLSGIIRAYTLMRPDKDIMMIEASSVLKKFKDKFFSSNVSREQIELCEKTLGIELNKFIEIVINGIKDENKSDPIWENHK
jgi:predicted hydrolase (HD superfamily)